MASPISEGPTKEVGKSKAASIEQSLRNLEYSVGDLQGFLDNLKGGDCGESDKPEAVDRSIAALLEELPSNLHGLRDSITSILKECRDILL